MNMFVCLCVCLLQDVREEVAEETEHAGAVRTYKSSTVKKKVTGRKVYKAPKHNVSLVTAIHPSSKLPQLRLSLT